MLLNLLRLISLVMGILFPFVITIWKIVIIVLSFTFRVIDDDQEKKLIGVTSLFFIGMIVGFLLKLL